MWDKIVYFFEEIAIFFSNMWESMLSSFAGLVEAIPVPAFLTNVSTFAIPDSILFWAQGFQIPAGIAIIVSAYIIRFTIRRIPIIG